MPRKSSFGGLSKFNVRSTATRRLGVRSMALEPLEERRVLAAYINEVYFNPPGTDDASAPWDYAEIRGTVDLQAPNALDNYYLIFIENENNGSTGVIDSVLDLSGHSLGSNGFLALHKPGSPYPIDPNATSIALPGNFDVEGGGFTAMLIHNVDGVAPEAGVTDIDRLNNTTHVPNGIDDGMDYPTGQPGWVILDAVGVIGETGEADGRLYAPINFGPEAFTNIEPGAVYVDTTFDELEYIGRWGDSTGQTADDWHVSNLTDRAAASYTGTGDFRQSGDPHPANINTPPVNSQVLESTKQVPYRTNITGSLGTTNLGALPLLPLVDLNGAAGGNNFASTWTNNGPSNIADSINAIASDGDSVTLASMTAKIVAGVNANNVLSATSFGGISVSYNPANSTLSMTGSSSTANYQSVLRSITYNNTAGGPGVGSVTINVCANDGLYHSKIADATVTISPNVAPVVDLNGAGAGNGFASTWTNAGPTNITEAASAAVTDSDNANLASMTATITSGSHASNVLTATAPGASGITVSYNAVSGVLSMTGTSSVANYQSTLRSITYNNTAGGPGVGSVTIAVKTNDSLLNSNTAVSTITISLGSPSTVANRQIFYNQSAFDNNDPVINFASDSAAIATDKTAYLPGASTAVFANVTSYTRGINGIIIDLVNNGSGTHANISASDFVFKMSANAGTDAAFPQSWAAAPAPAAVSVSIGGGVSGSDRVEITWTTNTIVNRWLEVGIKDSSNSTATGLAPLYTINGTSVGDVFFWGNRIGDGNGSFSTTNADAGLALNNPGAATVTNLFDYNRSATVTNADAGQSLNNPGSLAKINVGGAGPFAPGGGGGGGGDAGIASALAGGGGGGGGGSLPAAVATRLDSGSGGGGGGGGSSYFAQLAADDDASDDAGDDCSDLDDLLDVLAGGTAG